MSQHPVPEDLKQLHRNKTLKLETVTNSFPDAVLLLAGSQRLVSRELSYEDRCSTSQITVALRWFTTS